MTGRSQKAQVERLARQSEEIVNFLASRNRLEPQEWLDAIRRGVALGRIGPMKEAVNDLLHMARLELSPGDQKLLVRRLEERGFPVAAEQRLTDKAIEKILARGKIRTRQEYDLARARVEEMEAESNEGEEYQKLQLLVHVFALTGRDAE